MMTRRRPPGAPPPPASRPDEPHREDDVSPHPPAFAPRRCGPAAAGLAAVALTASLLLGPAPAGAAIPANVTAGELAMLPAYCIDTEGFMYGPENSPKQSPRAAGWVAKMGRSFWAMHHYCWGLVNLNRLKTGRAQTNNKAYFAKQIVNEYMYVVNNALPGFVLLPEIWTRIGEASLLAGDIGGAMDAYAQARQIKPDYWPAYAQWAEFQAKVGKKKEALELVRSGLEYAPDSVVLLDLNKRLGGGPPPPRVASAASAPASAPAGAADASAVAAEPAASATR